MKKIVVIPARLNSTRLPDKVLLDLKGKSVLQRVYEQCLKAKHIDKVYIATDSEKIAAECLKFTNHLCMTKTSHQSGTDRIAEAVKSIECDIVINVQGDEPFIEPDLIDALSNALTGPIEMASAMHKLYRVEDLKNYNVVKVIVDKQQNALYFSRAVIPHYREGGESFLNDAADIPESLTFYRHLGIYGYTKDFLLNYSTLKDTPLECIEKLEQLRVLENGYKIHMIETPYDSIGIDTEEDYKKALDLLNDI
jgi:3-deoxy-manno-octulosonate cytidylyltransferase (CMP-KDO synthetase)